MAEKKNIHTVTKENRLNPFCESHKNAANAFQQVLHLQCEFNKFFVFLLSFFIFFFFCSFVAVLHYRNASFSFSYSQLLVLSLAAAKLFDVNSVHIFFFISTTVINIVATKQFT